MALLVDKWMNEWMNERRLQRWIEPRHCTHQASRCRDCLLLLSEHPIHKTRQHGLPWHIRKLCDVLTCMKRWEPCVPSSLVTLFTWFVYSSPGLLNFDIHYCSLVYLLIQLIQISSFYTGICLTLCINMFVFLFTLVYFLYYCISLAWMTFSVFE